MFNIVIFGAPGSGKGTQSEKLIDEYGLFHISTGEVLRDHIARGTELGNVLDSNQETTKGVIFDGFPRTIPQAKALKKMLEERNSKVHAVVGLEVDDNELVDRLLKRGRQSGRSDDNLETINQRLKVYHDQTSPLRDYYLSEGKYHSIHGSGSIDDIFTTIKQSLERADKD